MRGAVVPVTVVIAEEIPSKNKGEAAILMGIRASLEPREAFRLSLISRYDEDRIYEEALELYRDEFLSSRQSVFSLMAQSAGLVLLAAVERVAGKRLRLKRHRPAHQALARADVLIVGHDNVFAKDFNLRCVPILVYAAITGKPVVSYGASIGPFPGHDLKTKLLRCLVLRRLSLVTLREGKSLEHALDSGIPAERVHVAADLAFLLEPASPSEVARIKQRAGIDRSPWVAMTATRLLLDHVRTIAGQPRSGDPEDYSVCYDVLARFIDRVTREHGVQVVLLAHAIGPQARHDDRPVNEAILQRVERKGDVRVVNDDLSAAELKGLLADADMLVGMRTHSLIAATGSGTPVMALTTEGRFKTSGIIGEQLGLADSLVSIEDLDTEVLCARFAELWSSRATARETLAATREQVVSLAKSNGRLLSDLVETKLDIEGKA
jgi:polysaccharide pyruvyl transferase WcaK-like protein